jgi:hypothetical protein
MFDPSTANFARAVDSRPTIDGRETDIVIKPLGKSWSLEHSERSKAADLSRKPRVDIRVEE